MARLPFSTLSSNIATLLPDNTTGEISPADVRAVATDLADTFRPAAHALLRPTPAAQALTTTDATLTVFDTARGVGETGIVIPNIANSTLEAALVGAYRADFTATLEGPNNDDVVLSLYRNAVATGIAGEISLRGASNPVALTFSFYTTTAAVNAVYTISARLRTGSSNVTFSNVGFALSWVPGQ